MKKAALALIALMLFTLIFKAIETVSGFESAAGVFLILIVVLIIFK